MPADAIGLAHRMRPPRLAPPTAAAALFFAALAAWMMHEVLQEPGGSIPGLHPGDNVASLWNTWWFAHAASRAQPVYSTGMLFAPAGTQLSLHTHATTHSVLAWPLASAGATIAAHNLAILAGLTLNGLAVWLLAFRLTGDRIASVAAGFIFSCSAFVQIHALGHVNLVHAWVLPAFALSLARLSSGSTAGALACGTAAALVVYTDYYFAIYAGILAAAWWVRAAVSVEFQRRPSWSSRLRFALLALLALDAAVIATIAVTGGTSLDLGVTRVSIRGIRNPLTVFWLLLALWLVARHPLRASFRRRPGGTGPSGRPVLTALATAAVLTAPLWIALARVVTAGDYATQQVLWRSSPAGADVATLLLGHPRHLVWGGAVAGVYERLGIDLMEQSLWLGIIPLAVIVARRRAWIATGDARFWLAIGLVFLVLSMGPFLRVAGVDTGLPLPQALLRYVPVFSNARIPGRAAVMVQLGVAVLFACAVAGTARRRPAAVAIAAALLLETMPAHLPADRVPRADAVDAALTRATADGAVAELPLGLRDGFGEVGQLDHRALAHQLWHQRPLVGGFVARLPERVKRLQLGSPAVAALVEISTPDQAVAPLAAGAAAQAAAGGIAFVVVNRDTFVAPRLPAAQLEAAGFTLIARDGPRELYSTAPAPR